MIIIIRMIKTIIMSLIKLGSWYFVAFDSFGRTTTCTFLAHETVLMNTVKPVNSGHAIYRTPGDSRRLNSPRKNSI